MIKTARLEELIAEHALLRKQAFMAAERPTRALFLEAEAGLRSCKTAGEAAYFNHNLLRHITQP